MLICTEKDCVLALGFFDGVHLGHAALLRRTAERAAQQVVVFGAPGVHPHVGDDVGPAGHETAGHQRAVALGGGMLQLGVMAIESSVGGVVGIDDDVLFGQGID